MSDTLKERVDSVKWHHDFELSEGIRTGGTYDPSGLLKKLSLPNRLDGLRVLDIGARDGFFTLELERRGATVVAIDYVKESSTGFAIVREVCGLNSPYIHANLYDLDEYQLGEFDIILFLGVLYHLPDPYLALEIVFRHLANNGMAYIETTCCDKTISQRNSTKDSSALSDLPIMIFAARNNTSFWDQNSECLRALMSQLDMDIIRHDMWGYRQLVQAKKKEERKNAFVNKAARTIVERG